MKPVTLFISALVVVLFSSGCYTKLYRANMEQNGPFTTDELYQRYDSTAIDTTLTEPEYVDTYPDYGYGWNSWGRPRGYTRWGFDFNRFSPDYYWSYYGYYDYYGRPWWDNWRYRYPWWYHGGGGGGPAEPPSQRPGRRMRDTEGSPPLYNPGGGSTAPSYAPPAPAPQPLPVVPPERKQEDDNSQKRNGKRRS
jgi:hypothetical protein